MKITKIGRVLKDYNDLNNNSVGIIYNVKNFFGKLFRNSKRKINK